MYLKLTNCFCFQFDTRVKIKSDNFNFDKRTDDSLFLSAQVARSNHLKITIGVKLTNLINKTNNLYGNLHESVARHAGFVVRVIIIFGHEIRLEKVAAVSIFSELALVELHELVARLEI